MKLPAFTFLVCAATAFVAPTGEAQVDAGALQWIERGKAEMKRGYSSAAERDFRKAIELEPENAKAFVLLTRALLGELPLNLRMFPDTQGVLPKAEEAVGRALAISPGDWEALCVAGIVNYKIATTLREPREKARRLNQAKNAFDQSLAANPNSAEANYELARMMHEQASDAVMGGRFASGMKVGQGGPIANMDVRHFLKQRFGVTIEEGLKHAKRALDIDPQCEPAMNQMAGLLLLRACLRDSAAEYEADFKLAQSWEAKEAAASASRRTTVSGNGPIDAIIGVIGALPTKAPPPPKQP